MDVKRAKKRLDNEKQFQSIFLSMLNEQKFDHKILFQIQIVHPLNQKLDHQQIHKMIENAYWRDFPHGVRLFDPLTQISVLFMIEQGEIKLSFEDRVVQRLGRGEIANVELSFGQELNELSAHIEGPTSLFLIPFEDIEPILSKTRLLGRLQKVAHQRRARAFREI